MRRGRGGVRPYCVKPTSLIQNHRGNEMSSVRPTAVTADKNQRLLIIKWEDGVESRLPYAGLRAECPCVECKGGHDSMGTPPNLDVIRNTPNDGVVIEKIDTMGSYALQILWSDGHDSGIYTWSYLRAADPEGGER